MPLGKCSAIPPINKEGETASLVSIDPEEQWSIGVLIHQTTLQYSSTPTLQKIDATLKNQQADEEQCIPKNE
jgi:hypothetical protein